ncbi:MAG: hypothetical protein Q9160_007659 [Pyrenula sp. 1 TL-2023]
MADKASFSSRYLAIPVLTLSTSVATILVVLNVFKYKSGPNLAISVAENATLVSQLVHVVSRILGTLLVYALCCAINLSARSYLRQNPITLDRLKLLVGLCVARIDWSLPTFPLLFLLLFVLASSVPGILWTGALTPVATTKLTNYQLPLPAYLNTTGFDAEVSDNATYTVNTEIGTFSWLPWFNLQGSIIQAARDASNSSTANGGLRSHAKLDRSGFAYTGRSYGMGAGVGLGNPTDSYEQQTGHAFGVPITGYKFVEEGLLPTASCAYNQSSAFSLEQFWVPPSWSIAIFNADGFFPNNATTIHAAVGLSPNQVVNMAAGSSPNASSTHYMALATGNGTFGDYGRLDKIQCDIHFEPKRFTVDVNTTLKTISVVPGVDDIAMPAHAHNLTHRLLKGLDVMGGVFDTSIWISIMGDVFIHNIQNIEARPGIDTSDLVATEKATFTGVKDSLESMLDNLLLAFASAQLMVYNDSHSAPAQAYVQATAIGTPRDIYFVFALNVVVCVVYAAVLVFLSRGPGPGKFNFVDVKSVVVGTSRGGNGIGERVERAHRERGGRWMGEEDDEVAGGLKVRFRHGEMEVKGEKERTNAVGGVVVVLADEDERTENQDEHRRRRRGRRDGRGEDARSSSSSSSLARESISIYSSDNSSRRVTSAPFLYTLFNTSPLPTTLTTPPSRSPFPRPDPNFNPNLTCAPAKVQHRHGAFNLNLDITFSGTFIAVPVPVPINIPELKKLDSRSRGRLHLTRSVGE